MVGADSTNQQEATDGQCLARAGTDQAGPRSSSLRADDSRRLRCGGLSLAGAGAGAGPDVSVVRAADAAPQHRDPGAAASGEDAHDCRGLLPGADAASGGGAAVAVA